MRSFDYTIPIPILLSVTIAVWRNIRSSDFHLLIRYWRRRWIGGTETKRMRDRFRTPSFRPGTRVQMKVLHLLRITIIRFHRSGPQIRQIESTHQVGSGRSHGS
jgi:hypothetical protein